MYCAAAIRSATCRTPTIARAFSTSEAAASLSLFTWGKGQSGALGHDSDADELRPRQVESDAVPQLASAQVSNVAVTCGLYHSGLLLNGGVWSWGRGDGGRLGFGDELSSFTPQALPLLPHGVVGLSYGGLHSAAAMRDGSVRTWGYGGFGALGNGETTRKLEPTPMTAPWLANGDADDDSSTSTHDDGSEQSGVSSSARVYCGGAHTLVVTAAGQLYGCGRDEGEGRLGFTNADVQYNKFAASPIRVELRSRVRHAAAGGFFSYAADADDFVWSWGANKNGELGTGGAYGGATPQRVDALCRQSIVQMAAGGVHGVALRSDGTVFTWGGGRDGQLGHGRLRSEAVPKQVDALKGLHVTHVACGGKTTYAVTKDGKLFGWGNNIEGQMGGAGTSGLVMVPTEIEGLPEVLCVAAGAVHAIALCKTY